MRIILFGIAVLLAISVISWLIAEAQRRRFQFTIRSLLIATALLATVLGVARWVYLARPWVVPEDDMAIVALCETDAHSKLLEYRVNKPFKLVLDHCLQKRPKATESVTTIRSEVAAIIASKSDVLRGRFVRFRVSNGKQIAVEANNETIWIASWLVDDAANAKWTGPGERFGIRCGARQCIVQMAASNDAEELIYLSVSQNE